MILIMLEGRKVLGKRGTRKGSIFSKLEIRFFFFRRQIWKLGEWNFENLVASVREANIPFHSFAKETFHTNIHL